MKLNLYAAIRGDASFLKKTKIDRTGMNRGGLLGLRRHPPQPMSNEMRLFRVGDIGIDEERSLVFNRI